jgi:hypothetical protein
VVGPSHPLYHLIVLISTVRFSFFRSYFVFSKLRSRKAIKYQYAKYTCATFKSYFDILSSTA